MTNNLGITKAEARAALRELETGVVSVRSARCLHKIGWTFYPEDEAAFDTALALVATIGGAVDSRGRVK